METVDTDGGFKLPRASFFFLFCSESLRPALHEHATNNHSKNTTNPLLRQATRAGTASKRTHCKLQIVCSTVKKKRTSVSARRGRCHNDSLRLVCIFFPPLNRTSYQGNATMCRVWFKTPSLLDHSSDLLRNRRRPHGGARARWNGCCAHCASVCKFNLKRLNEGADDKENGGKNVAASRQNFP